MKKEKAVKKFLCVFLALLFCVLSVRYSKVTISVFSYLALQSARSYLPVSSFSFEKEIDEKTTAESISETEAETEKKAEAETSAVTETTQKKEENKDNMFVLPEDIKKIIKTEMEKGKNDKKTGTIKEKKYTNEGVTDKEGAVKLKNTNKTAINIKELLQKDLSLRANQKEPSVLIFHTHTTESYQYIDRNFYSSSYTTRSADSKRNMVRIGEAIKSEIEKAGYKVLHDTTVHDTKYTGAYGRSRATVEAYLEKYPSIEIVLDIHRDGIVDYDGSKIKPTAVIDGKKVAQVMIISGCQEEENGITGFDNWKENLVFALKLQKEMEEDFPGLTRPVFFCGRKYNMDMTKASLLLEVGSDSNTIEEAYYAGLCIGKSVSNLLEKVTQ